MSAEMTTLFRFWGELLAGNFNRSMYSEFYMLAAEDLALGRHYGAQCLFRCYLAMLSSRSGGPDLLHDFETRALQVGFLAWGLGLGEAGVSAQDSGSQLLLLLLAC